ncbi:MAG: cupin domain-containing protein [Calditrichaeota bacterium]|nr:MAG: cupin domain-containing protein [Calditrichota bacterium]
MTKGKVAHYTDIEAKEFGPTAPGASIRVLIDDANDGAPVYKLRMIEIEPGGHSPDHSHPYEHENFIVEGVGQVMMEGRWFDVKPGDVVFVPPGIRHQYRNAGEAVFKFLCGIPVDRLMPKP